MSPLPIKELDELVFQILKLPLQKLKKGEKGKMANKNILK